MFLEVYEPFADSLPVSKLLGSHSSWLATLAERYLRLTQPAPAGVQVQPTIRIEFNPFKWQVGT
jgi:hypothetical protein